MHCLAIFLNFGLFLAFPTIKASLYKIKQHNIMYTWYCNILWQFKPVLLQGVGQLAKLFALSQNSRILHLHRVE